MSSTKFNIAGFARAAEENVYNDDDNMNIRHEDEFFENDEMRQHQDDFKERKSGPSFVQEDRKDWKPRHQDLEGERDKGVVPAEWRYGQQEVQRKGDKNTFYCEVCHVELNSLETMKSHANGAKHQKKMLALESERMENLRRGILPGEKMPGIKPIPNPASAKVSNDSTSLVFGSPFRFWNDVIPPHPPGSLKMKLALTLPVENSPNFVLNGLMD